MHVGMLGRLVRANQIYREVGFPRLVGRLAHRLRRSTGWITPEEAAWRYRKARIDAEFDDAEGVLTGGVDDLYALSITGPNARYGSSHIASDPGEFTDAVSALMIDLRGFVFVDLGSGKGRALLLATRLPFRAIVGVEFAAELHAVAQSNVATLSVENRARIRLAHADASLFDAPRDPLVVFLYNPFAADVMQKVARRLTQDVVAHPRPVYVVYLNPKHTESWLAEGWRNMSAASNFKVFTYQNENV